MGLSLRRGLYSSTAILGPYVDTTLLAGETDGLGIDFTETMYFDSSTWGQSWNQVRRSTAQIVPGGTSSSTTNGSSYTLTGLSVGAPATGRLLAFAVHWGGFNGISLSSATVNGASATIAIQKENTGGTGQDRQVGIIYVADAVSTVADVVLTFSGTTARAGVYAYSIYNADTGTVNTGFDQASSAHVLSFSVTVPGSTTGVLLAASSALGTTTSAATWGVGTENYDTTLEQASNGISGIYSSGVAAGATTVQTTWDANEDHSVSVGIALADSGSSADVLASPHLVYANSGTSAKIVKTSSTGLGWSPHNLLLYSQQAENSSWGNGAGDFTITANATTAPDGSSTARQCLEKTNNQFHDFSQSITITANIDYTFSFYIKNYSGGQARYAQVFFGRASGAFDGVQANIDLTTTPATLSTTWTASGAHTLVDSGIEDMGSGWSRVWVTSRSTSFTNYMALFRSIKTDGTQSFAGDASTGFYLWGVQLNRGIVPTAYIATTAAAVYGLPISYGEGLLVEPAATNLCLQSQTFGTTWTTGGTIASNDATAPDGSTTADSATSDGTGALAAQAGIAVTASTVYTFSCYLKAGANATWIRFEYCDSAFSHRVRVWFDISTGTKGSSTTVGSGTYTDHTITSIGNGWYRCTVSGTISTATSATVQFIEASADNVSTQVSGAVVSMWGAQLESGSVATSYIPTISSSVTRAIDGPNVATSAFPWTDATGSTIAWITPKLIDNPAAGRVFEYSDGATGNELIRVDVITGDSPDSWGIHVIDGGVAQVTDTVTKSGSSSLSGNKIGAAWAVNNVGIVVDAAAEVTDTGATMPTPTSLSIGYSQVVAARALNGFIKRLIYVPRRMTEAELQTATT